MESVSRALEHRKPQPETVSPNAVVVVWDEPAEEFRGRALRGTIQNNADYAIPVSILVVGASPRGEVVERSLGKRNLQGKAAAPVVIPVAELPVQSAGIASIIRVDVLYPAKMIDLSTGRVTGDVEVPTSSDSVFVSFDEDFGEATFRTKDAQAAFDTALPKEQRGPRRFAVRLWDESKGAATAAAPSRLASKDGSGMVHFITRGDPDYPGADPIDEDEEETP